MSFGSLRFGESCDRHAPPKSRGLDNRSIAVRHRANPVPPAQSRDCQTQATAARSILFTSDANTIFERMDTNNNKKLSLAELDKGVQELWPAFNVKPVIMRAYKACDVSCDGFVSKSEFKLFLYFLSRYQEVWNAFNIVDVSKDRRITFDEFCSAAAHAGLGNRSLSDLKLMFSRLDKNNGGFILFDEFADFLIGSEVNAERQRLKTTIQVQSRPVNKDPVFLELPSLQQEKDLFSRIDKNRNGVLSLAEVDKAVVELWPTFDAKPVIFRAFKASDKNGSGWLSRREFKAFLIFIVVFQNLWERFTRIDRSHDRRITIEEFVESQRSTGKTRSVLEREFREYDSNGGGVILFDEFCAKEAGKALSQYFASHPADTCVAAAPLSLFCALCGETVPDLQRHDVQCRDNYLRFWATLPSFLQHDVPPASSSYPTDSHTAEVFNIRARMYHQALTNFQCPECRKTFSVNHFPGHFRIHQVPYSRKMEYQRMRPRRLKDISVVSNEPTNTLSDCVIAFKRMLISAFDLKALQLFRRLLHEESVNRKSMTVDRFEGIFLECASGTGRCPPRNLVVDFLKQTNCNAQTILKVLSAPPSEARQKLIRECFKLLDGDEHESTTLSCLRSNLSCKNFCSIFQGAPERHVSQREFEQVAADLSALFEDDAEFGKLLQIVPSTVGEGSLTVLVTFMSGRKQILRVSTPGGTISKDPACLMRRISQMGVKGVTHAELL